MTKYRAIKTEIDGIVFDSKKEGARYLELKLLVHSKQIFDLELQPVFPIVIDGEDICKYKADFRYKRYGRIIIEDVKGMKTPVYRLKKKLVEAIHGVTITEV